jgi:hypothetical protein
LLPVGSLQCRDAGRGSPTGLGDPGADQARPAPMARGDADARFLLVSFPPALGVLGHKAAGRSLSLVSSQGGGGHHIAGPQARRTAGIPSVPSAPGAYCGVGRWVPSAPFTATGTLSDQPLHTASAVRGACAVERARMHLETLTHRRRGVGSPRTGQLRWDLFLCCGSQDSAYHQTVSEAAPSFITA